MERVLIFENTNASKDYIEALEGLLPKLQDIINQLVQINITPNIQQIGSLIQTLRQNKFSDKRQLEYIENYVREQLANCVEHPQIGGIRISRAKLLEMIEIPSCQELFKAIQKVIYNYEFYNIDLSHCNIVDNKVIVPEESRQRIRESNRIYTTDPKQITVYNWAVKVLESMKEFDIDGDLLAVLCKSKNNVGYYIDPQRILAIK